MNLFQDLVRGLIFILIFFIFTVNSGLAASINLSQANLSTLTDISQEYQVKVDLLVNADDNTKYYLRGLFYQTGTNKYCGFTWNGQSWYKGPYTTIEGWKNLQQIIISSNSASILLKAKLDADDNDCQQIGNYSFKVQRYTEAGSSTIDPQNEQTILIDIKFPTPTSIPSATPKKTPSLTPTSFKVSQLINTPTTIKVKDILIINSPTLKLTASDQFLDKAVARRIQDSSLLATSHASIAGIINKNQLSNKVFIPLILGIIFIFSGALLSFKKIREKITPRHFDKLSG